MRIAVAGATGTVGREVVTHARTRGHDVVELARSRGVDLVTGAGVAAALAGADTVIDVASVGTLSAQASTTFFRAATGNLLREARRTGAQHAVLLSIVGINANPHGYYAGKVAQEELVTTGPVPWTIVRATQFHEFAGQVAAQAKAGPLQLAPRARVQPIAAVEVARHLVGIAENAPIGRATDITGPREEELAEMVRAWVRRRGARGPVLAVPLPTAQMRGMRRGAQLPGADALRLGPTYADWLSARG
ncbi:SDR family oxidoreductase [Microbacterium telephonicum]|uniref:Uncharacterized protein YbjT (DUF2867 family) n=1 Tax=Microbacterium telephonicum TaxID=1714841 RepID=A0A498C3P6_9MICO|nr:NAD(P)H-binding protein [Microbacterium telephonicum]RLK47478.1 uncharacterized protein YbjT (DUF2867 family) [Microbacterium telephonicum]